MDEMYLHVNLSIRGAGTWVVCPLLVTVRLQVTGKSGNRE